MTEPLVRSLVRTDWPQVQAIYAEGIAGGHATFETETPSWESFDSGKLPGLRLVAVDGDQVLGWAAASATSARPAYFGVVEHSVYVAPSARSRGIGHMLLDAIIDAAEAEGIWTMQSGVFPENAHSLALHSAHGFRIVGRRERVARMSYGPLAGVWRDTVLIERRSSRVGSD